MVPSPQQVKKSPANSGTLYGSGGSGLGAMVGGTPGAMGGLGNTPGGGGVGFGGYDSPSAAMALGSVDLDGIHGLVSEGLVGGLGGRGMDDEKRRQLENIIQILSNSKGRLSAAGVERLAQRLGLEIMWDDNMKAGSKTLIIAGSAHLALDIDFMNDAVVKVALSFAESPESVTRHTEKAGDILMRDLEVGVGESTLTKKLDRFAANLERLAMLDKLSGNPGLNCHEAVAGIFESLERLQKWEVERVKEQEDMGKRDAAFVERVVMCTKSGRPVMHTRDRLGLSLEYWQTKRLITSKALKHDDEKTWSLLIECAPLPSLTVFPPLRVSSDWISKNIMPDVPREADLFADPRHPQPSPYDWLEPDSTVVPAKDSTMDGTEASKEKVLDVIFMAKFDPPLTLPKDIADRICEIMSAPYDVYQLRPVTFDELLFPRSPDELLEANATRKIVTETHIRVPGREGKEGQEHTHKNNLYIEKIVYGRTLSELPFSHPQQLVTILPWLRQYAFLSSLLLKTFGPGLEPKLKLKSPNRKIRNRMDEFDAFMKGTTGKGKDLQLDVLLQVDGLSNTVRLRVIFPLEGKDTVDVGLRIGGNGRVEVESENVIERSKGKVREGKKLSKEDLGTVLEICEDLGVWAEFVRGRLG